MLARFPGSTACSDKLAFKYIEKHLFRRAFLQQTQQREATTLQHLNSVCRKPKHVSTASLELLFPQTFFDASWRHFFFTGQSLGQLLSMQRVPQKQNWLHHPKNVTPGVSREPSPSDTKHHLAGQQLLWQRNVWQVTRCRLKETFPRVTYSILRRGVRGTNHVYRYHRLPEAVK